MTRSGAGGVSIQPALHPAATTAPALHPDLIQHLHALASGPRRLLGVVGPPGAGKSTLARMMVQAVGESTQVVPMDGFHLAQAELERLRRAARKGAPDTFDAAGHTALLRRLRAQATGEVVCVLDFRREIEEPVVGLLDEVWYLQVEPSLRLERLAQRHEQLGRSLEAALAWIASTDEPNARRIDAVRHGAQRQIAGSETKGPFTGWCPEGHSIAIQAVFPQRNISPGEWVSCSRC